MLTPETVVFQRKIVTLFPLLLSHFFLFGLISACCAGLGRLIG